MGLLSYGLFCPEPESLHLLSFFGLTLERWTGLQPVFQSCAISICKENQDKEHKHPANKPTGYFLVIYCYGYCIIFFPCKTVTRFLAKACYSEYFLPASCWKLPQKCL